MHLGNIWVSDHFGKCAFFFWNVFRSKNLNLEKKISNVFFVLEDTSINPKSSEWRSHEKLMCGESTISGGEVGANSNVY